MADSDTAQRYDLEVIEAWDGFQAGLRMCMQHPAKLDELSDKSERSGIAMKVAIEGERDWALGPRLRYKLLLGALQMTPQAAAAHFDGGSRGTFSRLCSWTPSTPPWERPSLHVRKMTQDMLAYLDLDLRKQGSARSYESLVSAVAIGDTAVEAFKAWLRREHRPPGPSTLHGESFVRCIEGPPSFAFVGEAGRRPLLAAIHRHLSGSGGSPLIQVVHGHGMPYGLTALGLEVFRTKPPTDRRPWLYLPISRALAHAGGQTSIGVSHASVVARLHAFMTGRNPNTASLEVANAHGTELQIAVIREQMARYPVVLIIDGFETTPRLPGRPTVLVDRIRDEPLVPLLERLVQPHVGRLDKTESGGDDQVPTRILVLGNRSLHDAGGMGPYLAPLLELHGVGRDSAPALLEALFGSDARFGLRPAEIDILTRCLPLRSPVLTDTKLLLLRSLCVLSGSGRHFHTPVPVGRALKTDEMAVEVLSQLRRRNETAFWAAAFISLSETGLRPATFRRLMFRWQGNRAAGKGNGRQALFALVEVLGRLVKVSVDEVIPALHGSAREAEYDPAVWGEHKADRGEARLYEIIDPEVRAAINASLERDDPACFHDMHLLLAEESLQQHTLLARHAPAEDFNELRFYRRLMQGLYHGFMSVPVTPHVSLLAAPFAPAMLPANPDNRLRTLVDFFYIHLLEHAPNWALTRQFGHDVLKMDILQLALARLEPRAGTHSLTACRRSVLANAARTALRNNHLEEMSRIIKLACAEVRGTCPRPYARLDAERYVLLLKHDEAWQICAESLQDPCHGGIEALPREVVWEASLPSVDLQAAASRWALTAVEHTAALESSDRHEVSRLIEKLSYVEAHHGEYLSSTHGEMEALPSHRRAYFLLYAAMEYRFRLAEAGIFVEDHISATSGRGFLKSALYLGSAEVEPARRAAFYAAARQVKDRMTQELCGFRAEKANLLINEALFARLASSNPGRAAELLREAEPVLPAEQSRPRVRMRFLAERSETFRHLAQLAKDHPVRSRLMKVARRDASQLLALATSYKLKPYEHISDTLLRNFRN